MVLFSILPVFEIFPFLWRMKPFDVQKSSLREAHRALHPFTWISPSLETCTCLPSERFYELSRTYGG
jgi:hypothetical protein